MNPENLDKRTVQGFGSEWLKFDQSELDNETSKKMFHDYFHIFPFHILSHETSIAMDFGCGSGRWARWFSPHVQKLLLLDASSEAIQVAKNNMASWEIKNTDYICASIENSGIDSESLDCAYSLGVLHHVPDTAGALKSIREKLKPGAPLLLYLYYALEGRPWYFRALWRLSDLARRFISSLPFPARWLVAQGIAFALYFPIARMALLLDMCGKLPKNFPLDYYRNKPLYVLRTDALDRFGTRLEKRFTKSEIEKLVNDCGFDRCYFSDRQPFHTLLCYRSY